MQREGGHALICGAGEGAPCDCVVVLMFVVCTVCNGGVVVGVDAELEVCVWMFVHRFGRT